MKPNAKQCDFALEQDCNGFYYDRIVAEVGRARDAAPVQSKLGTSGLAIISQRMARMVHAHDVEV